MRAQIPIHGAHNVAPKEVPSEPRIGEPPRLWGKHAVAAALDNPSRKVLRAWATRDAAALMQFPKDVAVTFAEAPDLGRLVPYDAPHQGVVIKSSRSRMRGSTS